MFQHVSFEAAHTVRNVLPISNGLVAECVFKVDLVTSFAIPFAGLKLIVKELMRQKIAQTIRNAMDTELGDFTLSSVMKSAK